MHLKPYYERLVNSFPVAWLKDSATGEEVANLADGERRLRIYAVANNFDVIHTGGGNSKILVYLFKYIYHGIKTANKHYLKNRVERDEKDKITSRRRRKTRVR